MWSQLTQRFSWLDPNHPIAIRETRRNSQELPKIIRKLTEPWTLLGYAAMLHGIFFLLSLLGYSRINSVFPNLLLPFLTPFGTPVAVGIIHSLLYWAMLIGICNYTTYFVTTDLESGMWRLLRLTPYAIPEILLVKLAVVWRIWGRVLRILVLTRIVALLLIPISILADQNVETPHSVVLNVASIIAFLAQPFVDAFLAAALALLVALLVGNLLWAKVGAYAVTALTFGILGGAGSMWMIFKSPIGAVAGIFVPLNHWGPLATAIAPPASPTEALSRSIVVLLLYLIVPLLVGYLALRGAAQVAKRLY